MFKFTCSKCGISTDMDQIKDGWTREIPKEKRISDHLFSDLAIFTCDICNKKTKDIMADHNGDIILCPGQIDYHIYREDFNTHKKIVGWITHLTEKNWVTTELINSFVILACKLNGLEAHENW